MPEILRPPSPKQNGLPARLEDLAAEVVTYAEEAKAAETRRVYSLGFEDFRSFCEKAGARALPATPETVALYLADRAGALGVSSLEQRLAAIRHAHLRKGLESPTAHSGVRQTMSGIRRRHGRPPEQKAPLLLEELRAMIAALPGEGACPEGIAAGASWLRGLRNRALLLLGFAGAFRRSELAAIEVGDLTFRKEGVEVLIRRSKTDQEGKGQTVGVHRAEGSKLCPVANLERWLEAASIEEGPVFRGVRRNGKLRPRAITGRTVRNVVKRAAEAAGLKAERFGGHSLRAGHITQAALNGAPTWAIMEQSRHKSERVFRSYIRKVERFEHNSSKQLGL